MNTVLLTGAGFSFNWGGRLAREVNTAVARRVSDDANLAALLHRNPNFEEALAELQNAAAHSASGAKEQLQRLEAAIVAVFDDMNAHLSVATFSFRPEMGWMLPEFLVLFDAIFTLNQDLLLESHYLMPAGIGYPLSVLAGADGTLQSCRVSIRFPIPLCRRLQCSSDRWRPVASPRSTVIGPRHQPYSSCTARRIGMTQSGGHLLVMGGNKPTAMQRHPILTWYAEKFAEAVSKPNARLR